MLATAKSQTISLCSDHRALHSLLTSAKDNKRKTMKSREKSRPLHFKACALTSSWHAFCQVGVVRPYKKRFRLLLSSPMDLNCDLELAVEVQQWPLRPGGAKARRKIEKAEAPAKESNNPHLVGKQSRNYGGGHVFLRIIGSKISSF